MPTGIWKNKGVVLIPVEYANAELRKQGNVNSSVCKLCKLEPECRGSKWANVQGLYCYVSGDESRQSYSGIWVDEVTAVTMLLTGEMA